MPHFVDLTHDDEDGPMDPNVIDLTRSPTPPPSTPPLPPELPAKTPFCIGQLNVTALILYPLAYIIQSPTFPDDWAPVRLQHEHSQDSQGSSETIHIISPNVRVPTGDILHGEAFGLVEQKVTTTLGPMMGKGLIRLEAKVQRGSIGAPILPLRVLVCTPKGNIPVVGNYLRQYSLLLDNPTPPLDYQCLSSYHYHNPHNPPPGGFDKVIYAPNALAGPSSYVNRWSTPSMSSKSVEVQRSQVVEVFKSLRDGDELAETEPSPDVATKLYPHQKKGLTFLLEREREVTGPDGSHSSLWQSRTSPWSRQKSWLHIITQKELFQEPVEAKGAILADDMGLGKTITCVSLIAATLDSARAFAASSIDPFPAAPDINSLLESLDGGPSSYETAKGKAKAARAQEKFEAEYARASRIKVKCRASLIVCPLSTVSNWEDQFREHWRGPVSVLGGGNGACINPTLPSFFAKVTDEKPVARKARIREGTPLRIYVYHGNARRPDPKFLADFDVVITTYATLASEYSKQIRCIAGRDEEDEGDSSDGISLIEVDEHGNPILKPTMPKKNALKRKKSSLAICNSADSASPLQSIHWFRVVLDEAHSIKETGTVASRASCDLMADRRLCLTGTPVQNKLDDVYALIKFLRLHPFDDKNIWTEFVGSPVKFGQDIGIARLQTIMKCITLRRTKETKAEDGNNILALPPRRDELRFLQFDPEEQEIYNQYFQKSKAEFAHLSRKNEVMKNYVGILQKILRLRQICDHFELVKNKEAEQAQDTVASYESVVADIINDGLTQSRACTVFALLRESATTQCVECGIELCPSTEACQSDDLDGDGPPASKRGRKTKTPSSRAPTRANSPAGPRPVLTRCQHLFCLGCYRSCVWPEWPNAISDGLRSCSTCQTALAAMDAVEIKNDATSELTKRKAQKREKRLKGASLENYHPSTKVKALMQDLVQSSRANPYSTNYDPSTVDIQSPNDEKGCLEDNIVKTVVFSQWTSMLDKVEDALEAANIHYDRLDGTMRRDERVRAMEALKHDPRCEVLLVSLKAGGVGLNLTAAQRVYLMDPYWNPAVENQAVDRIHRLGQTKPVTTVRLVIENTIEARLLEVQKQKTELANMTLGQHLSKAELMQRRMEELAKLFAT